MFAKEISVPIKRTLDGYRIGRVCCARLALSTGERWNGPFKKKIEEREREREREREGRIGR